jgi:exopolysaccharide biosynthesis polyprenyl glycosylphosphotransferase
VTTIPRPVPGMRVRAIRAMNARGFRLLHAADAITIYTTLWVVTGLLVVVRPDFHAGAHVARYLWSYMAIVAIHLGIFYFGGMYDRERRLAGRSSSTRIVTLVWIGSLVVGLASWLLDEYLVPRSVLILYALIGSLGLGFNRRIARRLDLARHGPARLLLVGASDQASLATRHLEGASDLVVVVGRIEGVREIELEARRLGATEVLLLDRSDLDELYAGSLASLESAGVTTLQVIGAQDSLLGLRNVGEVGGMPIVLLSTHVLTTSQARLKRAMDLAVLVLTMPITVPLLLFTSAYVALVGGRPLLFVQERVRQQGKVFRMFKFRTMTPDAEASTGPVQAAERDPRVVRGLGWLRATRFDELPQLINVALGHMTIVGPRPERPAELIAYEREIPGYRRRHHVPPGITGLAQVRGRYHTDISYKLGHDLVYLANWSPVLDLQIMARTVWVIATRRL